MSASFTNPESNRPTRTRIAPSPTGLPHFGLLIQAALNSLLARQEGGTFVLRIEDTDQNRYDERAEAAILATLDWAHLMPDEGPHRPGRFGPYRQSERLDHYQRVAQELVAAGHAYYCFCSNERLAAVREAQQAAGQQPRYDQHCRQLPVAQAAARAKREAHVIRLKVPTDEVIKLEDAVRGEIIFHANQVDDQVLLKSDGFPTYHLAVVVDDHLMEITHVIRGEEWLSSSPKHLLLYRMLGWQVPIFIHTPTLRNPDKSKLSKRHGHSAVEWYQAAGFLPEAVVNFILNLVWTHPEQKEIFSWSEVIEKFEWRALHITGPVVDLEKLRWLNGHYLRQLTAEQLADRLTPFLPTDCPAALVPKLISLIQERLTRLAEFEDLTSFFYREIEWSIEFLVKKATPEIVFKQLMTTRQALAALAEWTEAGLEETIRRLESDENWLKKQYFMMLRYALTGQTATPPLFATLAVLGRELVLMRLETVARRLAPS